MKNDFTFIAWGGNPKLANKIGELLIRAGFNPIIGGDEQQSSMGNFFLGPNVIEQIKRASRAIILVQWPPEPYRYKSKSKKIYLRPNIMFEWGMLLERLEPQNLHIYVIGLTRNELFNNATDLAGIYCREIQMNSIQRMANLIVQDFRLRQNILKLEPEELFVNWSKWKEYWTDVVNRKNSVTQLQSNQFLIYSLQPAFYNNDLELSKSIIHFLMQGDSKQNNQVCNVMTNAIEYYEFTNRPNEPVKTFQIRSIINRLSSTEKIRNNSNLIFKWVEIVRLNFLGLAQHQLAILQKNENDKRTLFIQASESFENTFHQLQKFKERGTFWYLWVGYVTRNLGRVYEKVGKKEKAIENLLIALETRTKALNQFIAMRIEKNMQLQLQFEVDIAILDLIRNGYYAKQEISLRINEVKSSLQNQRPPFQTMYMWWKTLEHLEVLAKKMKMNSVNKDIDKMKSLFLRS